MRAGTTFSSRSPFDVVGEHDRCAGEQEENVVPARYRRERGWRRRLVLLRSLRRWRDAGEIETATVGEARFTSVAGSTAAWRCRSAVVVVLRLRRLLVFRGGL